MAPHQNRIKLTEINVNEMYTTSIQSGAKVIKSEIQTQLLQALKSIRSVICMTSGKIRGKTMMNFTSI